MNEPNEINKEYYKALNLIKGWIEDDNKPIDDFRIEKSKIQNKYIATIYINNNQFESKNEAFEIAVIKLVKLIIAIEEAEGKIEKLPF